MALALKKDDIMVLAGNGCLSVPDPDLADEFIAQYFLSVHPHVPLLDEAAFWECYKNGSNNGESPKISLVLFQALLFVASAYVAPETLKQLKLGARQTASKIFYNRAKVIYFLIFFSYPVLTLAVPFPIPIW